MSELDFDELDKAVNNLMSGVPKVEPPKNDDIKTLDIDSTLPNSSRPSLDELDSALTAVNGTVKTETPPPATPAAGSLATRRSGRFMDVVHPSSDMKNTPKSAPSRHAATIEPVTMKAEQPAAPVSVPEDADDTADKDKMESAPVQAVDEHVAAHTQNEWPDPLDMSGYDEKEDTTPVAEDATPVETDDTPEASDKDDDAVFAIDDLEDTTPAPLTSPFITDAKVEKRPLGGPATDNVSAELETPAPVEADESAKAPELDEQLPAAAADVAPILPPELQSDLMAIETDDTSAQAVETVPEPTSTESNDDAKSTPESAPVAETEKAVSKTPTSTGPTSIPQQYKEEPSTSDQTNGGIYDTNNYHQPLAHPVKKKSGWLWIVWIILLLILGGGGAAVLYLFHII